MLARPNELQWRGSPGHYEVYYVTLTDAGSGVGVWLRYTLLAPISDTGQSATCSLWLLAADPRLGEPLQLARKATFPIAQLEARSEPFALRINGASLSD